LTSPSLYGLIGFKLFYSNFLDKKLCATLAQSVEQRTENPRVAGSIPAGGTTFLARFPLNQGSNQKNLKPTIPACPKGQHPVAPLF
jgi:hypothetical protein